MISRYLSDFSRFAPSDIRKLIHTIDTLDDDFYVYRGAEFWKDAAVTYLNELLREIDRRERIKIWGIGTVVLCSALVAFVMMKK